MTACKNLFPAARPNGMSCKRLYPEGVAGQQLPIGKLILESLPWVLAKTNLLSLVQSK